nr:unnamed protein product [Digitaria exilis]CAB3498525.1 unnamed protein product [Digitaria exilis]CAB3498533.1 unnamed protein product [Digitaria exilis]
MDKALVYGTRDSGTPGPSDLGRRRGQDRDWKRNPNPQTLDEGDPTGPEMAASSVEKLKALWDSQVNDEEQWALNYVLLWFESVAPVAIVLVLRDLNSCDDDLPLQRIDSTARLPLYHVCAELWALPLVHKEAKRERTGDADLARLTDRSETPGTVRPPRALPPFSSDHTCRRKQLQIGNSTETESSLPLGTLPRPSKLSLLREERQEEKPREHHGFLL